MQLDDTLSADMMNRGDSGIGETSASCCSNDRRLPRLVMDNLLRRLIVRPKRLVGKYLQAGEIVADLGSGPGFFTLPIAKTVGVSGRVYAVDFDAKSIEALEGKVGKHRLQGVVEAHAASAAEIDFLQDASVDFVFVNGLLCCMLDHAGALRQIRRILKPKGRARLSISKLIRKRDPRAVTKGEWEGILGEFGVLERGESLTQRWALLSLK